MVEGLLINGRASFDDLAGLLRRPAYSRGEVAFGRPRDHRRTEGQRIHPQPLRTVLVGAITSRLALARSIVMGYRNFVSWGWIMNPKFGDGGPKVVTSSLSRNCGVKEGK